MATLRRYVMSTKFARESTPRNWESVEREFERLAAFLNDTIAQVIIIEDTPSGGGGGGTGDVTGPGSSIAGQAAVFVGTTGKVIAAFTNTGVVKATAGVLSTSLVDLVTEVIGNLPVTHLDSGTNAGPTTAWFGDGTWKTIADPSLIGHDLLSLMHLDTIPAAPQLGDLIYAGESTPYDLLLYWLDGFPLPNLPSSLDVGTLDYWIDGFPLLDLGVLDGDALWQRKPAGTEGQVLKMVGGAPAWADATVQATAVSVSRATDLDVTNNVQTTVDLSTVAYDPEGFWSAGSPSRLTVPTGLGGKYLVTAQLTWDTLTVASLWLRVLVNGVEQGAQAAYGMNTPSLQSQQAAMLLALNAGDYVQMAAFWELTTGTRRIKGGSTRVFLQLTRLGD